MAKVCLDSNVVQWGIIRNQLLLSSTKRVLPVKAFQLIRYLQISNANIVIPTIAVGEILVPFPQSQYELMLDRLRSFAHLSTYTTRAASIFANLISDRRRKNLFNEIRHGNIHSTKAALKADLMIAATAIAQGAITLYTEDHDFLKLKLLIKDQIKIELLSEFTPPPVQLPMSLNS